MLGALPLILVVELMLKQQSLLGAQPVALDWLMACQSFHLSDRNRHREHCRRS